MPPIERLKTDNVRQGFFERPQFEALVAELPDYLHPVVRFAYFTGWRIPSEILTLTWARIDFEAGVVRLEPGTTKNREGRTFPFTAIPELEALLREQRELTTELERATGTIIPWVFHRDGERIVTFRKAWAKASVRAGLGHVEEKADGKKKYVPHVIPHDFRRTAVRNLVRAGVPRTVAMKLTEHKTETVFNRYDIVEESDLREGVEKLAALHKARAGARSIVPFPGTGPEDGHSPEAGQVPSHQVVKARGRSRLSLHAGRAAVGWTARGREPESNRV